MQLRIPGPTHNWEDESESAEALLLGQEGMGEGRDYKFSVHREEACPT